MSFSGLQKQQQQHQQPTQRTQEEERCRRRTKSTRSYYSHRRKVFCGFSSRLVLSLHCILFLTFLLDNSSKISTVYAFAIPTSSSSSSSSLSYNKNVNTMLTRNGKATTASTPSTNLNGGGGRERKPTTSTTKLHMIAGPALAVVGGALSDSIIGTMTNPFWKTCGIYVACDVLGFIISYVTGSHVHLDLIGTGAFAVATLPTLLQDSASTTQYFSSMAVLLWSTRLASFLFYRATQVGNDKRLETMLSNVPGMIQFWGITLLWNIFCSLPHNLGLLSSSTSTTASAATTAGGLDPTIFLKAGGFVYVVGLIIEVTSDFQKWFFKKSNPGKFCNVGMFKYSQHPHYFGNLVLWAGIFIMNLPGLIDTTTSVPPTPESASTLSIILSKVWSYRKVILSLLSPIFMWSLFSGQANGTATNAMELATTKYGNDPNYKVYLERTPKIIPKFW